MDSERIFFCRGLRPEDKPESESDIKAWCRYHSFHLRDPYHFPPIYFALAILFLCGGERDDYFYVTEDVYRNFCANPMYQIRLARYICPYYKCHTWPLLFAPWTERRFINYIRHAVGKYEIPLTKLPHTDTFVIEKCKILFPSRYIDFLPYFIQSIDSPNLPELPTLPPPFIGRPKRRI